MALQHVHVFIRWATCRADKWVHTANVTLLWQSDTMPGLLLSPGGVCACVWECVWVLGRAISVPVYWQGHYLPLLCPCAYERGRQQEEDSWLNSIRNTWEKLPDLPKSSQMRFRMNTHTHRVWAAHSACQGLITLLVVQSTISVHRSWLDTTRQLALLK